MSHVHVAVVVSRDAVNSFVSADADSFAAVFVTVVFVSLFFLMIFFFVFFFVFCYCIH